MFSNYLPLGHHITLLDYANNLYLCNARSKGYSCALAVLTFYGFILWALPIHRSSTQILRPFKAIRLSLVGFPGACFRLGAHQKVVLDRNFHSAFK